MKNTNLKPVVLGRFNQDGLVPVFENCTRIGDAASEQEAIDLSKKSL